MPDEIDRPRQPEDRYPLLLQIESPMQVTNGFVNTVFRHEHSKLRVDAMLDPARCRIAVNDLEIPTDDIKRITLVMEFNPTERARLPFTTRRDALPPPRLEE